MLEVSLRAKRILSLLAGVLAALALVVVPVAARTVARSSSAKSPSLNHLKVIPAHPVAGKGFRVSFHTKSGGAYTVFYSTGQNGGPLVTGHAKAGKTVKTKVLAKSLRAGKYTIGVDLSAGTKTKRYLITVHIKKKK
jgi:hypothetical protein